MKALRHPRQWLSGALLVGFLVMAIAGALFVYLADEVGEQAWLTRVDWKVAEFFHRHGVPFLVHAFESVTFFGSAPTLAVLGLAVALVLCTLRRWSLLLGWVAALAGTGLLNTTLKGVIRRLRPQLPEPWVTESGWSFPSGHVMGSLVAYGFLAYLLTRITPPISRAERRLRSLRDSFCSSGSAESTWCSFPERRYRRVHGGSRLAHVLHPHHPPDARPVARIPNLTWHEASAGLTSPPRQDHHTRSGVRFTPCGPVGQIARLHSLRAI